MLTIFGVGLMFAAGLLAYACRRCFAGRIRVIGGLLVVCLPALAFTGVWVWSELADKTHAFHALPPEEGVSIFEFLLVLPIIVAPFWLFGAICGYLLRWPMKRP
jgi:hypothetical protein